MGCVDKSGKSHVIGDYFTDPTDACSVCTCVADDVISCKQKQCSAPLMTSCRSGNHPVLMPTSDGCCTQYACDCELHEKVKINNLLNFAVC